MHAASGRASCKDPKCKEKILKGTLRVSKEFAGKDVSQPSPHCNIARGSCACARRRQDHVMKHHYHPNCFVLKVMPR